MIVIPPGLAESMRSRLRHLLGDFDESLSSSVRGPYLIPVRDLDGETLALLEGGGARQAGGYIVPLGERSDLLERVEGDYCAVYRDEVVYTLDRRTARLVAEQTAGQGDGNPAERGRQAYSLLRGYRPVQWYRDKFSAELHMLFPLAVFFFVLSFESLYESTTLYLADPAEIDILLWALAPGIFYSLIVYLCLFRTAWVEELFNFDRFEDLPSSEQRRSRYTQVLLGLILLLSSFGMFDSLAWWFLDNAWALDGLRLAVVGGIALAVSASLLAANRRFPTTIVRILFVVCLILIFGYTDSPDQTIEGRSLFFQMVPIMVASFTIAPGMSFVVAFISILLLSERSYAAGIGTNSTAYLGFLLIAFISWLVTRGWEQALHEAEELTATLERRVTERTKQLAEANKFKSHFLAQISHELQSPIIAFSLFIKKNKPLLDEREGAAMQDETLRVLDMARSISTVSKIELDVLENRAANSPVDVLGILDQQVEVLRLRALEKGIRLEILSTAKRPAIWGNRNHLIRTIDNLLTNAIKYSDPGGTITVQADIEGSDLVVKFMDEGIGIPELELAHIYDRFSRASNVGSRPGTGLGLSMVRDMVSAMNGEIAIDSILGRGTTVTLRFPLLKEPARAAA